jgi:hypothetical protein
VEQRRPACSSWGPADRQHRTPACDISTTAIAPPPCVPGALHAAEGRGSMSALGLPIHDSACLFRVGSGRRRPRAAVVRPDLRLKGSVLALPGTHGRGQEHVYESVRSPAVRSAIQASCLIGYSRAFAPRP